MYRSVKGLKISMQQSSRGKKKKDRANLTTPVPFTPDVVGRCNHMLNYVNLKVLSVFGL